MARGVPTAMAAALLLLLLCWAAAAAPPPSPSPSPPPTPQHALGQLWGYLGRAGTATRDLLGQLRVAPTPERIRDAYEKGSAAVSTYAGILTDQLYHWWQGDE